MQRALDPDRHLPRYVSVRRAVALGTVLLGALTVWAASTEVEVVVTAPAAARPVAGTAELRAPDTRAVARVHAREGQRVAEGDVVVALESALLDSERRSAGRALAESRRSLRALRSVLHVLEAGLPADAAGPPQARLQVREHRSRLARLDREIEALDAELAAARAAERSARRLLAVAAERSRAAETASAHGAISRFELLAVRQELLRRHAELEAAEGQIGVLRERRAAEASTREGLAAGFRESLLAEISARAVEVAELETRLAEVEHARRQGRITAPFDGVVDRLRVAGGDFVERGEVVAVIVPVAGSVTFETRIAPRQAAFLHPGQACRIKLDALPFARYGAVPCTLELIGRDVVESERGGAYYLAKVRPASYRLWADGQPVAIQPGATARVDIIAGRRTVLGFVTEPLTRFARESLRER